jgi:hypothetical protein
VRSRVGGGRRGADPGAQRFHPHPSKHPPPPPPARPACPQVSELCPGVEIVELNPGTLPAPGATGPVPFKAGRQGLRA